MKIGYELSPNEKPSNKLEAVNEDQKNKNQQETRNNWEPLEDIACKSTSLATENSRLKVEHLNEYTKDNNMILINMMETQLIKTREKSELEQYEIFQVDRDKIKQGGAAVCTCHEMVWK